jgi:hypothetical protein
MTQLQHVGHVLIYLGEPGWIRSRDIGFYQHFTLFYPNL